MRACVNLLLCIEVYSLMYLYLNKIYEKKYKRYIYWGIVLLLSFIKFYFQLLHNPLINILVLIVTMYLMSFSLFRVDPLRKMVYNLHFIVILLIIDIFVSSVFSIFDGNISSYLCDNNKYVLSTIIIMLFNFIAYSVLSERILEIVEYKTVEISKNEILLTALMGCFQIMSIVCIALFVENEGSKTYILIGYGVGAIFLMSYQLYSNRITAAYFNELRNNEIKEVNARLQEKYYNDIEKKNENYRKLEHDISKHLNLLEQLLLINENNTAQSYIKQIRENNHVDSFPLLFSNKILRIIIGEMYYKCQLYNIECRLEVANVGLEFVDSYDLTTMLGNVIDNAIEACLIIQKNRRYILFRLYEYSNFVVLHIENSFIGSLQTDDNNNLQSSKAKSRGMGLSIIRETVCKYNGDFQYKYDIDKFEIHIVLQNIEDN